MRLLHTTNITLSTFYDESVPPYAILSHTWGDAEVSFQDLLGKSSSELSRWEGYSKIQSCCALAAHNGYKYVWIDTCCIDKTSSAELSEAINSMYRWYQEAQVCYAYLADVRIMHKGQWCLDGGREFRESRWFTRGWTLQELLAPKDVVFYGRDWQEFGSLKSLRLQISLITGIQQDHMFDINRASAAQKMSWASGRKTTRVEDVAYSLMGIFDVNMPLLYGEGKKAFTRLQHEIVKISDDESIFAWMDDDLSQSGMFAQSPKVFAESGNVVQIPDSHRPFIRKAPYTITNRGLAIEIFPSKQGASPTMSDRLFPFVTLNCGRKPERNTARVQELVIELKNVSRDQLVRSSPGQLHDLTWPIDMYRPRLEYVRPHHVPYNPHEQRFSFFIKVSLLSKRDFYISQVYRCQPCPHLWDALAAAKRCWKITFESCQRSAALLLESGSCRRIFGVVLRAERSSLIICGIFQCTSETFEKRADDCDSILDLDGIWNKTRMSLKLHDNHSVSVTLEDEELAPGEWQKLVEVHDSRQPGTSCPPMRRDGTPTSFGRDADDSHLSSFLEAQHH